MTMGASLSGGTEDPVRLAGICKAFGPIKALNDVSLSLRRGEIHALLGENGAGKSTLMNVLFGMLSIDAGSILIDGVDVSRGWSTRRAIAAGIGMVHQHFSLVGDYTVLENVVLPTLRWSRPSVDWAAERRRLAALCQEYGLTPDLDARVEDLSVGERQQVEILKMLFQGSRILILDEPTSVLAPQQAEALLATLRRFRDDGYTVVIITHNLDDAMRVCDRITVLRQGCKIDTVRPSDVSVDEVASLMVAHSGAVPVRARSAPGRDVALGIRELRVMEGGRPVVDGVTLDIRCGEVVGVAGVAGNGQSELAEALLGCRRIETGRILLGGSEVSTADVAERRRRGLAFVPEDRHAMAMVGGMSVAANMALQTIGEPAFSRFGVIDRAALADNAQRHIREFGIRVHSPAMRMGALSGGNQQKVVMARELSADPSALVVSEPSRGLDFAAGAYVRDRILESAERGVGILLISSDLEELMLLSHRIVVMYHGRIIGELDASAYDVNSIGLMMAGIDPRRADRQGSAGVHAVLEEQAC